MILYVTNLQYKGTTVRNFIFEWRHHPVKIRFIKDVGVLEITPDEKLGPFKEGEETKLPYWQAKILIKHNNAQFVDFKPIQTGDLHKILYKELPNPQLTQIDPNFYVKMHDTLLELTEQNKQQPDLLVLEKIKKMKSLFRDVISRRFYKLLRIAATRGDNSDMLKNASNEEKDLYKHLQKTLTDWGSQFLVGD